MRLLSNQLLHLALLLTTVLTLTPSAQAQYKSIFITPKIDTLNVNEEVQYHAFGVNQEGKTVDITDQVKWQSVYPIRFEIGSNGKGKAIQPGLFQVSATYSNMVSVQAMGTVRPAIQRLVINATKFAQRHTTIECSVETGAINGKLSKIPNDSVTWKVFDEDPNNQVLKMRSPGQFYALNSGDATITASLNDSVYCMHVLTVADLIKDLRITSGDTSILQDNNCFFSAYATFESGDVRKNVTQNVRWSSTNPSVGTISKDGQFNAKEIGTTQIVAEYMLSSINQEDIDQLSSGEMIAYDTVQVKVINPILRLHIYPRDTNLRPGQFVYYKVIADFQVGPSRDIAADMNWKSSRPKVAKVSSTGDMTPLFQGTSTITASYEDKEVSAIVAVTNPIKSVAVRPSIPKTYFVGDTIDYLFTLRRETGSKPIEVSDGVVKWKYIDSSKIEVLSPGKVICKEAGHLRIEAQLPPKQKDDPTSLFAYNAMNIIEPVDSIAFVKPITTLKKGEEITYEVNGYFRDGSVKNVTNLISWGVYPESILHVIDPETGKMKVNKYGKGSLYAHLPFSSAHFLKLDVSVPIPIVSFTVAEENDNSPTILYNQTTKLIAIGVNALNQPENLNSKVQWSTSNPKIGELNKGTFKANKIEGKTTITAKYEDMTSSIEIHVYPTLDSIWYEPKDSIYVAKGDTVHFKAGAKNYKFKDSPLWSSSNSTILNPTYSDNSFEVNSYGNVLMSVLFSYYRPIKDTVMIRVIGLDSMVLHALDTSLLVNKKDSFWVEGYFSNGEKMNMLNSPLRNKFTITSSNAKILSVSKQNTLQALSVGSATITAKIEGSDMSISKTIHVVNPLVSVKLTPNPSAFYAGDTLQFTATGTFKNGEVLDITKQCEWESSDTGSAYFAAPGELVGKKHSFPVSISLHYRGKECKRELIEVVDPLDSVWMKPGYTDPSSSDIRAYEGMPMKFEAGAMLGKGIPYVPSTPLIWESSDNNILSFEKTSNMATFHQPGKVWVKVKFPRAIPVYDSILVNVVMLDSVTSIWEPANQDIVEHDEFLVGQACIHWLNLHFSDGSVAYQVTTGKLFPPGCMNAFNSNPEVVTSYHIGQYSGKSRGQSKVGFNLLNNDKIYFHRTITVLDEFISDTIIGPDTVYAGTTFKYYGLGNFEDEGTRRLTNEEVTWSIDQSNGTDASIDSNGVLRVNSFGLGEIYVKMKFVHDRNVRYANKPVRVGKVQDMQIYPSDTLVFLNDTIDYRLYSNSPTFNQKVVKWYVPSWPLAIDTNGIFVASNTGRYTIIAQVGSSLDTINTDVIQLEKTFITPSFPEQTNVHPNDTLHFQAWGTFMNPSTGNYDTLLLSQKRFYKNPVDAHWSIQGTAKAAGIDPHGYFIAADTGQAIVTFNSSLANVSSSFHVRHHFDYVSIRLKDTTLTVGETISFSKMTLWNTKTGRQQILDQWNESDWSYRMEVDQKLGRISKDGKTLTTVSTGQRNVGHIGSVKVFVSSIWGDFETEFELKVDE